MVNGKQLTVLWHVDDLWVSHVDPDVVTDFVNTIDKECGEMSPITVRRGKVHDCLGMTLDFSNPGKAKVTMTDHINNVLKELPADMRGESVTPATDHSFNVNESAEPLCKEDTDMFHHNAAKALFLCERARPGIQTPVAVLCARVKKPDVDDCKKLKQMMQHLRATRNLALTLEANNPQAIKWWVDASFAVHQDMRSHTVEVMSLGKGAFCSASPRQKINTKSSTEAKLVGVDDVMGQLLWT